MTDQPNVHALPRPKAVPSRGEGVMLRAYVEYEAARLGVPAVAITREALYDRIARQEIDVEDIREFMGRRGADLADFLVAAKVARTTLQAADGNP